MSRNNILPFPIPDSLLETGFDKLLANVCVTHLKSSGLDRDRVDPFTKDFYQKVEPILQEYFALYIKQNKSKARNING